MATRFRKLVRFGDPRKDLLVRFGDPRKDLLVRFGDPRKDLLVRFGDPRKDLLVRFDICDVIFMKRITKKIWVPISHMFI